MFDQYFSKRRIYKGMEIEDSIMTIPEKEEAIMETPFKRQGLDILWFIIVFCICGLTARVAYLDIVQNNYYSDV